jgi:hypothetical protein
VSTTITSSSRQCAGRAQTLARIGLQLLPLAAEQPLRNVRLCTLRVANTPTQLRMPPRQLHGEGGDKCVR